MIVLPLWVRGRKDAFAHVMREHDKEIETAQDNVEPHEFIGQEARNGNIPAELCSQSAHDGGVNQSGKR